ncbi:hypothetical protein QUB56_30385 [Microcoleus sp. AR_TQ3_B6]
MNIPSDKKCDRPKHIQRIPGLLSAALDTASVPCPYGARSIGGCT